MKLFEGDRHEILNELDRSDVYAYLGAWFVKNLA
jgi:alpha-beta hydrolase superfamily lysophospholipase